MLVFIDESGDSGFLLNKGSSKVFVIACILFRDELVAEQTALAIKLVRRKLKFSDNTEFKFSGSKQQTKVEFLTAVFPFDFQIRTLVVEKSKIRSSQLKTDKKSFYSYFIKMVLKHSGNTIFDAKIKLDHSGDRIFRRNFTSYLRKQLNSNEKKIFKQFSLVDSKQNVLIQLADMIAGTIRRYHEKEKADAPIYWKLINKKIKDCWIFK
jgi:hypothetical protein